MTLYTSHQPTIVIEDNQHGDSQCGFSILLLVIVIIAGGIYFWRTIRLEIDKRCSLFLLGSEDTELYII